MNKLESDRFIYLESLAKKKQISGLESQPKYKLHNINGEWIADYTPEFFYRNRKGECFVEELKGSYFQHSATRQDYVLRVKWFLSEYKEIRFIQIVKKESIEFTVYKNKTGKLTLRKTKL